MGQRVIDWVQEELAKTGEEFVMGVQPKQTTMVEQLQLLRVEMREFREMTCLVIDKLEFEIDQLKRRLDGTPGVER